MKRLIGKTRLEFMLSVHVLSDACSLYVVRLRGKTFVIVSRLPYSLQNVVALWCD